MSDLSKFQSELGFSNKALRVLWAVVYIFLFRPSPRTSFGWRRFLLRLFGSEIGRDVRVYSSARIYYPPNLTLGDYAIVGERVDCYCVGKIEIGEHTMISQYSFLCTATHDYKQPHLPLVVRPIKIGKRVWICADVFVGPGVHIGENAVVGARSSVFGEVAPDVVVAGNPAKKLRKRNADSTPQPVLST